MAFEIFDKDSWIRKEHFEHYYKDVPCTYSICCKLDITRLIKSGKKLYPAMLFFITKIVNRHEEFRMAIDKDGNLGRFDSLSPCYTIFHRETKTFSNIWTEYSEDYETFLRSYEEDKKNYGDCLKFEAKPDLPQNTFTVSMLPWVSFDGFNLNLQRGYDYLLPIFTMGKYYEDNGRFLLPLSVQVHHAVCDGFHVGIFIEELQNIIATE